MDDVGRRHDALPVRAQQPREQGAAIGVELAHDVVEEHERDGAARRGERLALGEQEGEEGEALLAAALQAPAGLWLEVGTYCGKSTVHLGAAAREVGAHLVTLDHHRGSEENQPGWEWHDPTLVDERTGTLDTLPTFRHTVWRAGLEGVVIAVVGSSPTVAAHWSTPCALVFIDGGHGEEPAFADYRSWAPKVASGGLLAIHDVFPDPRDGGRPPYEVWLRAKEDGFEELSATGSLRVLRKP
jgi:predicted O-methyltransferase YrrM